MDVERWMVEGEEEDAREWKRTDILWKLVTLASECWLNFQVSRRSVLRDEVLTTLPSNVKTYKLWTRLSTPSRPAVNRGA